MSGKKALHPLKIRLFRLISLSFVSIHNRMPRSSQHSRKPIYRKRFGGVTISVQRCKKPGYEAIAVIRRDGAILEQKYCGTQAEGKALGEKWAIGAGNLGAEVAASVSESEQRRFLEHKNSLAPFGKTVCDAVRFYLEHLRAKHSSRMIEDVVDALLIKKQKKKVSKRYQEDLQNRLTRFQTSFAGREIAEIEKSEVEEWLESLNVEPVTYNNYRRLLNVLWSFAHDQQWAQGNIITRIDPRNVKAEPPGILSVESVRKILQAADVAAVPYLSIAFFGGLRDAELKRLAWKDVNFHTKHIRIRATVAKGGRERLVPLSSNLQAWLEPYKDTQGLIAPSNLRTLLDRAKQKAKLVEWPHDATRHSFGTYEMARTRDIGTVSEIMGNSPAVVKRHYQAAVQFDLGDEYFSIFPSPERLVQEKR
ncbi:hypothetical protein FEM03_06160 [Phragmitibacter flavus]|uniref:Tyr recombinase domain-containing protein n=1 Tax=Phragmitibacter flavus TaxID=2576071 RepID=A0A5R8KHK7_9BACT|nr:tyrosine-type recombinase/integrase [Phragmitibacter flavus]TLD71720.1 hypothetical protein FEM03_06160 [Phragmitibacter flavus]